MMIAIESRTLLAGLLIAAMLAAPTHVHADDSSTWTPPPSEKWDWLHLNSGEWLKGEVDYLRDRKIRFDSDELDDLDIDLADCQAIYLNRLSFLRLESGETPQGRGVLRGDVLIFETVDGRKLELSRDEVVSIVPGGEDELDYWSFLLGVDYGLRDGNTEQVDLSGHFAAHRRTATLRFLNEYRGVYGSQNDEKITNNHRVRSSLDVFLTSRFYLTVPTFEYYQDEFKNLKHRVSSGLGAGYEFVRNSTFELDVGLSAVHQYQESEDGGEESNDFGVVASLDFDIDFPGGTELDNSYRAQVIASELDKTSHHFESILSVDIWGPLDLDVTFILDRIENPEADGTGSRPEENDISILAGMSIEF